MGVSLSSDVTKVTGHEETAPGGTRGGLDQISENLSSPRGLWSTAKGRAVVESPSLQEFGGCGTRGHGLVLG